MPVPSSPRTTKPRKNRQQKQLLITAIVMGVLAIGVVGLLATSMGPAPQQQETALQPQETQPPEKTTEPNAAEEPTSPQLLPDNGRRLWASPTAGQGIALDWLPPGCEMILHARPAAWLQQPQGQRTLAVLGPKLSRLRQQLEQAMGLPLEEVDQLLVGLRSAGDNQIETAMVVRPIRPLAATELGVTPVSVYRVARQATYQAATYRVADPWCWFAPPEAEGKLFVVAPQGAMQEILEAGGAPPVLRREAEQLAATADCDRHLTLLTTPSFLFTDGRTLFAGPSAALRDPLFDFVPDTVRAATISAHWGELFYLEARSQPAAEITATRLAGVLKKRLSDWPDALQLALLDQQPPAYSRQVVARLPAMVRLLAEFTRTGVQDSAAVLNAYLPLSAGQNLAAAAELLAAQLSAGGATIATDTTAPVAKDIQAKLAQRVSVSFSRDTLEMAVQYLADELGVPMVLLGGDLRLEGITKNQSFALDARDLPASEVLLQIVQQANPDRTATGPTDPRQKLIYVVKPDESATPTVYVTTRAAATQRGDRLPPVFVGE